MAKMNAIQPTAGIKKQKNDSRSPSREMAETGYITIPLGRYETAQRRGSFGFARERTIMASFQRQAFLTSGSMSAVG
jgi:hypothetical protein